MEVTIFKRRKSWFSVDDEVSAIYQMLFPNKTFKAFCRNNQVFDVHKQKRITNKSKLFSVYKNSTDIDSSIFIFNQN